jgi:hypothetical protein
MWIASLQRVHWSARRSRVLTRDDTGLGACREPSPVRERVVSRGVPSIIDLDDELGDETVGFLDLTTLGGVQRGL